MEPVFLLNLDTAIETEGASHPAVEYAIRALRRDMERTLDAAAPGPPSRILLSQLSGGELPPESYRIAFPDDRTLHVTGGGPLGLAYGLYCISEKFLGVHPFWYWNDQAFAKAVSIPIPVKPFHSPQYRIRYRGWFVNDEVLIDGWGAQADSRAHWEMVFEALLRCGGNLVIPGTGENSRKNRRLAAKMGLGITHHHAEPLGAEMFLRAYPDKIPSYDENAGLFQQLWEQSIREHEGCEAVWNLGFRGQGDRPFWEDDPRYASPQQRGELISRVIADQYALLQTHGAEPVCCTNLYGEILELYRQKLLKLPEGVLKIWADNGYGRMVSRRQGNHNPRADALPAPGDAGPHGLYYHCSFHDLQASNHLTMSPNSAEFLSGELQTAFDAGADAFLLVNCGSVKPHVYPLDLMRELWKNGSADPAKYRDAYVRAYYGGCDPDIRDLLRDYAGCTILYGPHADDRAGEQIYHHPVRELLCGWLSGRTRDSARSLLWLTPDSGFESQVFRLKELCLASLPGWERLDERCRRILERLNGNAKQLFSDSIRLQVELHRSGARGAAAFCESYLEHAAGHWLRAFLAACRAEEAYSRGIAAMEAAGHDQWQGYYDNDCLTNLRLTRDCMQTLSGYLRVLGDGPSFQDWERKYLAPEGEREVALISSVKRPLSDRQLYRALNEKKGE